jgi:hypothetical protein
MDKVTRLMGKLSLVYLALGFILGAVLMAGKGLSANWGSAWGSIHAHVLFAGWFVQFAVGIAYWLLPRRKSADRPLGYDERLALLACGLINAGLLLRVALEPLFNLQVIHGPLVTVGLTFSGILQAGAGLIWAFQLWGRFFRRYSATTPITK